MTVCGQKRPFNQLMLTMHKVISIVIGQGHFWSLGQIGEKLRWKYNLEIYWIWKRDYSLRNTPIWKLFTCVTLGTTSKHHYEFGNITLKFEILQSIPMQFFEIHRNITKFIEMFRSQNSVLHVNELFPIDFVFWSWFFRVNNVSKL